MSLVGIEFYEREDRGNIPEWTNRFAVMQWPEWLTLDGVAPAADIGVPTIMIHSDGSAFPDNVRRLHDGLSGPKTLCWMETNLVYLRKGFGRYNGKPSGRSRNYYACHRS